MTHSLLIFKTHFLHAFLEPRIDFWHLSFMSIKTIPIWLKCIILMLFLFKSNLNLFCYMYLLQGFLRNERENALLAVIEQTRRNVSILLS